MAATWEQASIQFRMAHLPWNAQPVLIQVATYLRIGIRPLRIPSMCLILLPPHYKQSKLFLRWLYSYFLAVDANFRLKLKSRGISDPEIGSGWSYFVRNEQYSKHISQKTIETEVSSFRLSILANILTRFKVVGCGSDFHAVNQANSKSSKDYVASGVVACVCARHSLMQKNGVGDLQ